MISWIIFFIVAMVIAVAIGNELVQRRRRADGKTAEPEESLEELMVKGIPPAPEAATGQKQKWEEEEFEKPLVEKAYRDRHDASRFTKYVLDKEREKVKEFNGK